MRSPSDLFEYQQKAVNIQCTHRESALWLDMGLGKSVITLTSIAHLIRSTFLRAVLIVAPIRVCRLVWRQEAMKWSHTNHLKFSMVMGSKDQRTRALLQKADIYLINYENLRWLSETLHTYYISKDRDIPFDGVVFDEISKCKNSQTHRVKSLQKILNHFKWRTGLTGTPAANGYSDLHGQYLVLDDGKRLGTSKTAFRNRFYYKNGPYKYKAFDTTEREIEQLIGDITLQMSAADYNPLPDLIVNDVQIELPAETRVKYEQLEREFFFYLDSGEGVEVFNAASLTNKCLAEGTEILTINGWMPIEQYTDEMVWDGVDWVNTSGLIYNGYKEVIQCWGIAMTSDHQMLTESGWMKAKDIVNGKSSKRHDGVKVRLPHGYRTGRKQKHWWHIISSIMESAMRLWNRIDHEGKQFANKFASSEILWMQTLRSNNEGQKRQRGRCTWNDRHSTVGKLVQYAIKMQQPSRQGLQKLRSSRDKSLQKMEHFFRRFLERHEGYLQGWTDYRAYEQQFGVFARELPLAQYEKTSKQPTHQCSYSNTNWSDHSSTSISEIRSQTHYHIQADRKWVVRVRLDKTRQVYDILNAGPRHRFTVRNKKGEVFLSHNCLQFSNGSVYPIPGLPLFEPVHALKLEALEDIIEEANGQPVLCAYSYRSDAQRIMNHFKSIRPINLTDCKSEASLSGAMARWKENDCQLMIGHPASMGHGIDGLQDNGHTLVWFGLNWSLDLYEQFNARLRRQGQGTPVICHRILTLDTMDSVQAEALDEKAMTQTQLRSAIKRYRDSKR